MKTPLIAFFCLLTLAVAGWSFKSGLESRTNAKPSAPIAPQQTESAHSVIVPFSSSGNPTPATATAKTPASVPLQNIPPPASYATPATPVQQPRMTGVSPKAFPGTKATGGSSSVTTKPNPPASSTSLAAYPAPYSTAASPSAQPASTTLSNGDLSGADNAALELDPGVPLPAALVTPEENQTPAAAAAQQQIADSFVQAVDAALSDPATSNNDAAINEAYFDSLKRSNEQYRALYGDEAYNRQAMKATMEALSGN